MERLLKPASIAVVGGGEWCKAVIAQNEKIGFKGEVWHVHPQARGAKRKLSSLPGIPDAVFVGVNRNATVEVVAELSKMGAGGAVCFANGFEEAADGAEFSKALVDAAGDMPVLGPNCYGLINAVDGVALWPDQHGLTPVETGVAILAQSSNMAINLTMQQRGLPISYVITPGNQTQQTMAQIAQSVIRDARVTALGLYVESFVDIPAYEALAKLSAELEKPIVALKAGQSLEAQQAALSHTASLTGEAAGAEAFMTRVGISQVHSLPSMIELLKIYHVTGRLSGTAIVSLSCSGGEAALMADTAARHKLDFPPLTEPQKKALSERLGPRVALSNPLDYQTDIWRNRTAMANVFSTMTGEGIDLTVIVLDFPDAGRCDDADWMIAVDAVCDAAQLGGRYAVLSSLPENMPRHVAERLVAGGIIPLCDFDHACAAIQIAANPVPDGFSPVRPAPVLRQFEALSEGEAKSMLNKMGLDVPHHVAGLTREVLPAQAMAIGFPVALKAEGIAHKTEAGGVVLGLEDVLSVMEAAREMDTDTFLVEEMLTSGVAELLVGIVADPAHGFVLTLAAGGVQSEILADRQCLLLPVEQDEILHALARLRISDLLRGYRGLPGAHIGSIVHAIMMLQDFVLANPEGLAEIEINPLICTEDRAIVADVLIVKGAA